MNAAVLQLLLAVLSGWLDHQKRDVLRYLVEENRVLSRQLGGRRVQATSGEERAQAWRRCPRSVSEWRCFSRSDFEADPPDGLGSLKNVRRRIPSHAEGLGV